MDLSEQPLPEDSNCPACGSSPTDESIVEHRLAATGYLHDDIRLECSECGERWTCGVPIGEEPEFGDDLWCDSCDNSIMLVHRVRFLSHGERVELQLKCPRESCRYYDEVEREADDGVALVGYPQLIGSMDGAEPFGY